MKIPAHGLLLVPLFILGCGGASTPITYSDSPEVPTYVEPVPKTLMSFKGMAGVIDEAGDVKSWGNVKRLEGVNEIVAFEKGAAISRDGELVQLQDNTLLEVAMAKLGSAYVRDFDWLHTRSESPKVLAATLEGELIGSPEPPEIYGRFTAVALTEDAAIALREDGSVFQWGRGEIIERITAHEHGRVVQIDSGKHHFIALFEDGHLATWRDFTAPTSIGCGFYSSCSQPRYPKAHRIASLPPVNLTKTYGAIAISATDTVNAAVLADGSVHIWGEYAEDFKPNFELENIINISLDGVGGKGDSGDYGTTATQAMALTANGEIVVWGGQGFASKSPRELSQIAAIDPDFGWTTQSGQLFSHSMPFKRSITKIDSTVDTVIAVHETPRITLMKGESGSLYADVFEGGLESLVIRRMHTFEGVINYSFNGKDFVYVTDSGEVGHFPDSQGLWQTAYAPINKDIVKVSMSAGHVLALLADGTATAWGLSNDFGEQDVPSIEEELVDIHAGEGFSLALTKRGAVYYWGKDGDLISPLLKSFPAIKALGQNGHSVITEDDRLLPINVDNEIPNDLGPVQDAVVHDGWGYALSQDGRLLGWGSHFSLGSDFYEAIDFFHPEIPLPQ